MGKVVIQGEELESKNPNGKYLVDNIEIEFEVGPVISWNTNKIISELPSDKCGVYVIYSQKDTDDCLYVGRTWDKNGFKGRFRNHKSGKQHWDDFEKDAYSIALFFIDKDKPQHILLFERMKIAQLNPLLNRDDKIASGISDETKRKLEEEFESYWLSIMTKGYLNEYLTDDGSNEEELKKIFREKYTEVIETVSFESILHDSI